MASIEVVRGLVKEADTKIVFIVIDGASGLPHPETGKTELEAAQTPNLDRLAARGVCGLLDPIKRGISPGSGIAHLALFGYDPFKYEIGRGAIAAYGIGFPMGERDVAVRMNFAAVDEKGNVIDRRAGRIPTEKNAELCRKLRENVKLEGVELFVEPVKDHRALLVLRGDGLSDMVSDTDPGATGVPPKEPQALAPEARRTAELVKSFLSQVKEALKDERPANMVLLRGFAKKPNLPSMCEAYKMRCACIATYPDYKGVARMVGMEIIEVGSEEVEEEFEVLRRIYDDYDFIFLHIKKTDSLGEDGKFEEKVRMIERVDANIPKIEELNPDVIVVTSDHSTPALYRAHSWHPVPVVIAGKYVRPDRVEAFSEREFINGGLGRFEAKELMTLVLAHADRLSRMGA